MRRHPRRLQPRLQRAVRRGDLLQLALQLVHRRLLLGLQRRLQRDLLLPGTAHGGLELVRLPLQLGLLPLQRRLVSAQPLHLFV